VISDVSLPAVALWRKSLAKILDQRQVDPVLDLGERIRFGQPHLRRGG